MLRSGQVDVAITFAYSGQHFDDDVTVEHLGWDALHLVEPSRSVGGTIAEGRASGEREATGLRPDELRRFSDDRWIAGCERCRTGLLDLCASVGIEPDIGFASDDVVAVQALVTAGFGVTLLSALALAATATQASSRTPLSVRAENCTARRTAHRRVRPPSRRSCRRCSACRGARDERLSRVSTARRS